MTVKELIFSCDKNELVEEMNKFRIRYCNMKGAEKLLAEFNAIEPNIDESSRIHAELYEDDTVDVTVIDDDGEPYSFKCSSWHDVLGWQVTDDTIFEIGSVTLAAEIIWEMTWFATTDAEMEQFRYKFIHGTGDGDVYEYDEEKRLWRFSDEEWECVKYISVRDFILSTPQEPIIAYWQEKFFPAGCEKNIRRGVEYAYRRLAETSPVRTGTLMVCMEHTGSEAGEFDAVMREYEKDGLVFDGVAENRRWSESIGSQVHPHNIEKYGGERCAAEFLWELTLDMSNDISFLLDTLRDGKEAYTFDVPEIFMMRLDPERYEEAYEVICGMWDKMRMEGCCVKKGVFWLIDGRLLCFPFDENSTKGAARSGDTYNHEKLWEHVRPKGCNKPYNYYPRGRVEITNKGNPRVYASPHIDLDGHMTELVTAFGLDREPQIITDYSRHYQCCLDEEWGDDDEDT